MKAAYAREWKPWGHSAPHSALCRLLFREGISQRGARQFPKVLSPQGAICESATGCSTVLGPHVLLVEGEHRKTVSTMSQLTVLSRSSSPPAQNVPWTGYCDTVTMDEAFRKPTDGVLEK